MKPSGYTTPTSGWYPEGKIPELIHRVLSVGSDNESFFLLPLGYLFPSAYNILKGLVKIACAGFPLRTSKLPEREFQAGHMAPR